MITADTVITAVDIVGWVIGVLGGLATVAQLFQVASQRREIADDARRAGADATQVLRDTLANTAVSLLQLSQDQIASLRSELVAAQDQNTALRSRSPGCAPESRTESPPRKARQSH